MKVRMLTIEFDDGPALTVVVAANRIRPGAHVTGFIATDPIDAPDYEEETVRTVPSNIGGHILIPAGT